MSSIRLFIRRSLNSSPKLPCTNLNLPNYVKNNIIENTNDVIEYEDNMAKKHVLGNQCEELLYIKAIKEEEEKNSKYGLKF